MDLRTGQILLYFPRSHKMPHCDPHKWPKRIIIEQQYEDGLRWVLVETKWSKVKASRSLHVGSTSFQPMTIAYVDFLQLFGFRRAVCQLIEAPEGCVWREVDENFDLRVFRERAFAAIWAFRRADKELLQCGLRMPLPIETLYYGRSNFRIREPMPSFAGDGHDTDPHHQEPMLEDEHFRFIHYCFWRTGQHGFAHHISPKGSLSSQEVRALELIGLQRREECPFFDWDPCFWIASPTADPSTEDFRELDERYHAMHRRYHKSQPGHLAEALNELINCRNEMLHLGWDLFEVPVTSQTSAPDSLCTERIVSSEATDSPNMHSPADFVIVTPLEEEREAMLAHLGNALRLPPTEEDVRVYYAADIPVTFSDGSKAAYKVVLTDLLGMGQVEAANAVGDAIRRWKPKYVVLVGIAGGLSKAGVKIGDVLISELIADYEHQKLTVDEVQVRWSVHRVAPRLLGAAKQIRTNDWHPLICTPRPEAGTPERHTGVICTGNKVIANGLMDQYHDVWRKLIGIEMEAGGVASAAFQAASAPGFFMVRGVSDLADPEKNEPRTHSWRPYACDVAAAFTIALLRSGPVPPRPS